MEKHWEVEIIVLIVNTYRYSINNSIECLFKAHLLFVIQIKIITGKYPDREFLFQSYNSFKFLCISYFHHCMHSYLIIIHIYVLTYTYMYIINSLWRIYIKICWTWFNRETQWNLSIDFTYTPLCVHICKYACCTYSVPWF